MLLLTGKTLLKTPLNPPDLVIQHLQLLYWSFLVLLADTHFYIFVSFLPAHTVPTHLFYYIKVLWMMTLAKIYLVVTIKICLIFAKMSNENKLTKISKYKFWHIAHGHECGLRTMVVLQLYWGHVWFQRQWLTVSLSVTIITDCQCIISGHVHCIVYMRMCWFHGNW